MKNIKVNGFTAMFMVFSILLLAIILVTDDEIELYEQITIQHGDTLWSLAEHYSGKMERQDWINAVKKENALHGEMVVSGQVLTIPVERNSKYIAELNEPSYVHTIKVVRENNESN